MDKSVALLLERAIIYTEHEDSSSRVIDALRAERRDDILRHTKGWRRTKAWAIISKRITPTMKKLGGIVIVRYLCVADKTIRSAPDRSVVSKGTRDILRLMGLQNSTGTKRTRAKVACRRRLMEIEDFLASGL